MSIDQNINFLLKFHTKKELNNSNLKELVLEVIQQNNEQNY